MDTIRAFIFDLDGVITDTAEYHYLAWKQLADEEELDFNRQDNEQLRGVSRRESLLRLLKGKAVPENTMQNWMERKNDYYQAYLQHITPSDLLPGVRDFLHSAKKQNLKLGIGSASKNAKLVIEKLNLLDMFDIIGDGYSIVNPKPAPDIFIWVAGGLQVPVQNVVVFEDASAGIDAAQTAGCGTVGIGTADVGHADMVANSFETITIDDVLAHFSVNE